MPKDDDKFWEQGAEPVPLPIDGILDLHMFTPQDAASVVDEYLLACQRSDIYQVKIVHGKGKGVLRRIVHSLLARHPHVIDFAIDTGSSSWGATLVYLKKKE